ncbi:MAG: C-GCAxxG-C-C family protein [Erysipelotrichaceae bacterium]
MLSKEEQAINNHHDNMNCAQSVLVAFSNEVNVDVDTLYKMMEGFGSGVSIGEVCGACTGMVSCISLLNSTGINHKGESKHQTRLDTNKYMNKFIALNGSCICRQLKANSVSCDKCIGDCARLVEEYIKEDNSNR